MKRFILISVLLSAFCAVKLFAYGVFLSGTLSNKRVSNPITLEFEESGNSVWNCYYNNIRSHEGKIPMSGSKSGATYTFNGVDNEGTPFTITLRKSGNSFSGQAYIGRSIVMTASLRSAGGGGSSVQSSAPQSQMSDFSTFFLRGKVKRVVEYEQKSPEWRAVYSFSTSGKLVRYQNRYCDPAGESANKIFRRNGRIKALGEQEYAMITVQTFQYNSAGKCVATSIYNGHGGDEYRFTSFNDRGFPLSAKIDGGFHHQMCQEDWTGTATYTYPSVDRYGNWTKCVRTDKENVVNTDTGRRERRQTTTVIIREITYY